MAAIATPNRMLAYRSRDKGRTWEGPSEPFAIDYSQHGFVPLVPRGGRRIYAFGTQPILGVLEDRENCPIGYRYSDDDGRTWSDLSLIRPVNDPGFTGMSVMRMTETRTGAWLIGSHDADWSVKPLRTRLYVLRSADRGATWTLLPGARPAGWSVPEFQRMDEGRPLALPNGEVLLMMRTPQGRLWTARSTDDGLTWSRPEPTPLIHPDAPPMLFPLSDGRTLAAFHHNRYSLRKYQGLNASPQVMKDRSEIWVSLSTNGGRTWGEPRFVFANAVEADMPNAFFNYQCSYLDAFTDGGAMHLFVPHRWQRALHLRIAEPDLLRLPTRAQLGIGEADK